MTATIATFSTEFNKFAPELEKDYIDQVTKLLSRILEKYPTRKDQNGLSSSWAADGYVYRTLGYRFLTRADGSNRSSDPYDAIDTEYLTKQAKQYAADQIAAFVFKLNKKLGALTDVEVKFASFGNFTCYITGKLGDKVVSVDQNRIINVSKNGNPFHQWPALIRVDGKRVSEAAFKKLV